jgi:cytochrome c-type biogenesis protein CcmH
MAVLAEQEDRPGDAATILRDMLAGAPPDAPWAEYIRTELVRLEAAPGVPDVPAGADFVPDPRVMVARLAERLKQDSSDFEGWLRLVRSYKVLGERDKARAAVGDARRAVATDPDKLRRIDDLVKELGIEG